jgi:hypothetical protein
MNLAELFPATHDLYQLIMNLAVLIVQAYMFKLLNTVKKNTNGLVEERVKAATDLALLQGEKTGVLREQSHERNSGRPDNSVQ